METRAGELLSALLHDSGARRLVRVTGWPAGVLVDGDTAYVNAAWLVALSPLSAAPPPPLPPATTTPEHEPLALDFNPYKLPGSLAVCAEDVVSHCGCVESGGCADEPPVEPSFSSALEECAWVALDASHSAALCILWLLSIDAIAECMPSRCRASSLEEAVVVAADASCLDALDNCMRGREAETSSSSCDSDCNDDCDTPDCSSPDCDSCNQSCDSCQQSCDSCNDTCDSTSGSCNDTCNRNCSVAPPKARGAPGAMLWLLLPLAYVGWRARRLR
jgi:hypothetical protein